MSTHQKLILGLLFICFSQLCYSQKRNNIWCFGDSSGIDFSNLSNPIPFQSGMDSRGSCSSISDSIGGLQFYASNCSDPIFLGTLQAGKVYTNQHQLMLNGDSLNSLAWYNELILIPLPNVETLYFIFTIGVTSFDGLYYSTIDLSQNGGLGAVIQKNIQLQNFPNTDCLNAIKHGNGRDWWVISRPYGYPPGTPNFEFRQYLITPTGIVDSMVQNIGSGNSTGLGKLTFSPNGNKLVFNNYKGLIEMYDYDRCNGTLSNPVTIHPENSGTGPSMHFWGCEFSPSGEVLYVTTSDVISYLFQFDLNATNIWSSIDTLWTTNYPVEAIGGLKRGPNGKIYESGPYTSPLFYNYPYPDSVYNMYNMNLGVINFPDSLGAACDFQPYSFYLGGKRTYWGLPNNPDYDLGPFLGSPCDSLTSIAEAPIHSVSELFVYYAPSWQTAFINANNLKGTQCHLEVFDLLGKSIIRESGKFNPPYFTKNLNCTGFAKGMYVVNLVTDKERLVKRFVVE